MVASTSVKTVDRLVKIIDSFSSSEQSWSLTDLSKKLDLPKSTLHRFLVSLEAHGLLRKDETSKQWKLGYRLFVWGRMAEESTPLHEVAKPIMRDLVADTGETALLTVYSSQHVICVEKVETSYPVRLALEAGSRRPPHAGASSKLLMAYLPDSEVDAIVRERGLPRLCANTITDVKELRSELKRIRERGYARSIEETDHGAWGIATPIRDWHGDVVAAIGIAGPTSRFNDEVGDGYVARCRQAAEAISALLFAQPLPEREKTPPGGTEREKSVRAGS